MGDSDQKGEDGGEATEETLKKLQEQYLRNLKLQGVEGIRKAFIRQVRRGGEQFIIGLWCEWNHKSTCQGRGAIVAYGVSGIIRARAQG